MVELFISETCPYSIKVMDFFEANNIEYIKRDIAEPSNIKILLEKGGKSQVPFLVDREHGMSLYESEDIIDYVKRLKR